MSQQIALLYGGSSSERYISCLSAKAISSALDTLNICYQAIDIHDNYQQQLLEIKADYCFIALHGSFGENGAVQNILENRNIPFSGSGSQACALAADKIRSKQIWNQQGLPVAPAIDLQSASSIEAALHKYKTLFIKPSADGSSFGMSIVSSMDEVQAALEVAANYDGKAMAEPFIEGREYSVAVLHNQPLSAIEIKSQHSFYDFNAKYQDNDTQYICPTPNDEGKNKYIQNIALSAHQALSLDGCSRIDLLEDQTGNYYLLEANAVPGLTEKSLVPIAAAAQGISFERLIEMIINNENYSPSK